MIGRHDDPLRPCSFEQEDRRPELAERLLERREAHVGAARVVEPAARGEARAEDPADGGRQSNADDHRHEHAGNFVRQLCNGRLTGACVLYQTDDLGRTECYAVARYDDVWRRVEGAWKLAERTVDLRTRLLPVPSPLPI